VDGGAGIEQGPVFRSVSLGGKLGARPLSGWTISERIKARVAAIGLDPTQFAGHSMRAGYVTSAIEAEAGLVKITEVTRHKALS
jgi:hypothetical protein